MFGCLSLLAGVDAGAQGTPPELLQAYKREFSVLESEKSALTRRLKEVEAEAGASVSRGEGRVRGLQQQIGAVREEADALEDELRQAGEGSGEGEEDLLGQIFLRASEGFAEVGVTLEAAPGAEAPAEARLAHVALIFERSGALLAVGGEVRREAGVFFLPGGEEVKGELLRVGQIATYGVSPEGAGALAPAGQGRLRLWREESGAQARALLSGERPEPLPIFLHEGLEAAIEIPEEKGALETVEAGGSIAWVIVWLGAAALLLVLARALLLLWSGLGAQGLVRRVVSLVAQGRREEALSLASSGRGSMGRALSASLRAVLASEEEQERLIAAALLHEVPRLERFGSAITVFAAVAPLLGLLGTVTGMIATFDIITEFGTGDPKLLSSGISEALITTELGLVVAIPTLLMGALLGSWAESQIAGLERGALEVLNAAASAGPAQG
jgi:biopolymer transport protein ExbB